jgi:hypothetical protein
VSTGSIDLRELAAHLASRDSPRAEATVQSDVRLLLLAAPLNLVENQIENVNLETIAQAVRALLP